MPDTLLNKVTGSIIGAAIGDAIGAVVELSDRETVRRCLDGKEWVEDMRPFKDKTTNPHGVFRENAPRGTGTDDTRLNQLFVECVIKNRGYINSQLLAMEYLDRYRHTERYYPQTPDLAKRHMSYFYPLCAAYLGFKDLGDYGGEVSPVYKGGIQTWNEMNGFPMIWGILTLQSAGLLLQDKPEEAYKKTAELDFFDIGYAKDATCILAAIVSAALSASAFNAKEIIDIGIKTNPYELGGPDGVGRIMTSGLALRVHKGGASLPRLFEAVERAQSDHEAVLALARECEYLHPFDPLDVLGASMAIIRYTNGDPARSIIMAANHRIVDANDNLIQLRDVDCVAMVTGAIVGAMNGLHAFPEEWVENAISANRDVYGFDIEQNAREFYRAVYG